MTEYTYAVEAHAKAARRALIDQGATVSLVALDPARDRYVFDAATREPDDARPYVIETWMGNRVFPAETFATFLEARDRIMESANALIDAGEMPESDFDGYCEDLYAVRFDGLEVDE